MQIVGFPMRRLIYLLNFDSSSTVMLQDLLGKNVVWNIYDDLLHSHLTQECGRLVSIRLWRLRVLSLLGQCCILE